MTSSLTHSFPQLGTLQVTLYTESDTTYKVLEQLKSASLAHLQSIDHLGELREVLHCGIHTRFEFLFFQLYLCHFFKKEAKAYGLSTKVSLPSGEEVSSCEELLKTWVFLDELGHLRGTYEAERFLLGLLIQNVQSRDRFLSAFQDRRGRELAEAVLEKEDIWALHRCIGWLYLENNRRMKSPRLAGVIDTQLNLLHALMTPADKNPALERAQSYYVRIRRLAHVYLDTAKLPSFIQFHPSILLQSIKNDPSAYLTSDGQAFSQLFGSMLDFLHSEIYSSVTANKYKLQRYEGLLASFSDRAKIPEKSPLRTQDAFLTWLFSAKATMFWGYSEPTQQLNHAARIQFMTDGYFEPDDIKIISEDIRFKKEVDTPRWVIFLTSYRGPTGHSVFIDLFERANVDKSKLGRVVTAILGLIERCHGSMKGVPQVLTWLSENQIRDVVLFILRRLFPGSYRFRLTQQTKFGDYDAVILKTPKQRLEWSKKIAWEQKRNSLGHERNWEITCLRKAVRNALKGIIICVAAPIIVEDLTSNASIAEFDGIFIRVYGDNVTMTVLEAKTNKKRAQSLAKNELKSKLMKMGIAARKLAKSISVEEKSALVSLRVT